MPNLAVPKSGLIFPITCNLSSSAGYASEERAAATSEPESVASCVRSPIEQMLRLLLPDYVGSGRGQRPHPFIEQAPGFFDDLQEERGSSSRTVEYYDYCLRSLQTYLKDIGVSVVKELSPTILSAFVTARGQEWGKSAMTVLCAALRVFLSYLHQKA